MCYMWDRVHRDVCLCAGSCACVRGRVQNPHVHGDVKNRNPSRKHIFNLYLMKNSNTAYFYKQTIVVLTG